MSEVELVKIFNKNTPHYPGKKQRQKSWKKTESLFSRIQDQFTFAVSSYGDTEKTPVLFIEGGPGIKENDVYKTLLSPRNSRHAITYNPRCVAGNQSNKFTQAQNNEQQHIAFIKSLKSNTLDKQVEDIEQIRQATSPNKKLIIRGVSSGTLFALAYAQKYPQHVEGLVLNMPFLATEEDFILRRGAEGKHAINNPEEYKQYLTAVGANSGDSSETIAQKYLEAFASDNLEKRENAFKHWMMWESLCNGTGYKIDDKIVKKPEKQKVAMIMAHYHTNKFFLEGKDGILDDPELLKNTPIYILGNSNDPLVSKNTLSKLYKKFPHAQIVCQDSITHTPKDEDARIAQKLEEIGLFNKILPVPSPTN